MQQLLITLIAFIFAIGILVVFHELGHLWVARWLGVKVLRFSVGFGKPLWRWHGKNQTEYVLSALPLGGYVKMLDEREGEVLPQEIPFAFNRKPVWARFAIVLAGPVFNFIFAIVAYWLMFMIGISTAVPLIGDIKPDSIAMHAGMLSEQEIVKVDHVPTTSWQQVTKQLMLRLGDKDVLEIETKPRDGQAESVRSYYLNLQSWALKGYKDSPLASLGIEPYLPPTKPVITEVISDEPAAIAGMLIGDLIIAINGKSVSTWKEFTHVTGKSINIPLKVTVIRNQQKKELTLIPREKIADTGEKVGFVGLVVKIGKMPKALVRDERLDPFHAGIEAFKKTNEYILLSFRLIGKLVLGEVGLRTLSGPITIAHGAGATVVAGFQYYLGFLALISISLGVLNLLPIPVLDGGHLLYFVIEMVTRRPVPENIQVFGFRIGMLLLLFLMTIAFYNDIIRLF